MIPKSGYRFSQKIMLHDERTSVEMTFSPGASSSRDAATTSSASMAHSP
jgi:hypothetical protein